MKTRHSFFLGLCLLAVAVLPAQEPGSEPREILLRTPEQLDELLGPIALYPDALIAIILPASTEPTDIVLAARFLDGGGDPDKIDNQPWDESARALARFPDVVAWLDENLSWTIQVGDAFLAQPADVMKSIQRLRSRARVAGTLVDTPQQQVVMEKEYIRIVPAKPEVIYVPYYDPQIVYVSRPRYVYDPFLTFGVGFRFGSWLSYDCDWYNHRIWYFDHRHHRRSHDDWRHRRYPGMPGYVHDPRIQPWQPPVNRFRPRPPERTTRPPAVVHPRARHDGWRNDHARNDTPAPDPRERSDRRIQGRSDGDHNSDAPASESRRERRGSGTYTHPAAATPSTPPAHSFDPQPGARSPSGSSSGDRPRSGREYRGGSSNRSSTPPPSSAPTVGPQRDPTPRVTVNPPPRMSAPPAPRNNLPAPPPARVQTRIPDPPAPRASSPTPPPTRVERSSGSTPPPSNPPPQRSTSGDSRVREREEPQ